MAPSSSAGKGDDKLISIPSLHAISRIGHSHCIAFLSCTPWALLFLSVESPRLFNHSLQELFLVTLLSYLFQVCCPCFLRWRGQTCGWDYDWAMLFGFYSLLFSVHLPIISNILLDFLTTVECWKWPVYRTVYCNIRVLLLSDSAHRFGSKPWMS